MDDIKLDFSKLNKNHPPRPKKDLPVLSEIPQDAELSRVMASQHDLKKLYAAALENRAEMGRNASVLHAEIHKEDKKVFNELGGGLVKLDESVNERVAALDEKTQKEIAAIVKVVREEVDLKVNIIHAEINRLSTILHDLDAKLAAINEFGDVGGITLATHEAVRKVEKLSTKLDEIKEATVNSETFSAFKVETDAKFATTTTDAAKLKTDLIATATSLSNFSVDVSRAFGEFDERTKRSLAAQRNFLTALDEKVSQLRAEMDEFKDG
jgi:hypothetical protein